MQITKDSIKKALEVLSHASKADYDGMEAEYFATIAKLSNDYDAYVKYNIVKNKLNNFIKYKLPNCPSCNDKDSVHLADLTINLLSFDPYVCEKNKIVDMYTDTRDIYSVEQFKTPDFLSLISLIKKEKPELSYLIDKHAYCTKCKVSFPASDFMNTAIGQKIPFEDIIVWSEEDGDSNDME